MLLCLQYVSSNSNLRILICRYFARVFYGRGNRSEIFIDKYAELFSAIQNTSLWYYITNLKLYNNEIVHFAHDEIQTSLDEIKKDEKAILFLFQKNDASPMAI